MKILSITKLAETVTSTRMEKGFTIAELGALTGISGNIIERIEQREFIPTISQFESLSNVLGFNISDMFAEKEINNSYIKLRAETLNDTEKEGVDIFFKMMIALRQQINLRKSFELAGLYANGNDQL